MKISIDGAELAFQLEKEKNLGDILVSMDCWLEGQGMIMSGVELDGLSISADIQAVRDREVSSISNLDIRTERVSVFRAQALSQSIAWLKGILAWCSGTGKENLEELKKEGDLLLSSGSGFLNAEEISFLEFARNSLDAKTDEGRGSDPRELSLAVERILGKTGERLLETIAPTGELRKAVALLKEKRESILNIPVFLQTGRDREALEAIASFTDIFSKAIRIMPGLNEAGMDTGSIIIDGEPSGEFLKKLNAILTELAEAFDRRDSVLIGDLSEYEILPRLEKYFSALEERIPEEA